SSTRGARSSASAPTAMASWSRRSTAPRSPGGARRCRARATPCCGGDFTAETRSLISVPLRLTAGELRVQLAEQRVVGHRERDLGSPQLALARLERLVAHDLAAQRDGLAVPDHRERDVVADV